MAFILEDGRINLFLNKFKDNLKAPLLNGKVNIDGTEAKVAAWKSKDGNGLTGKLSVGDKASGFKSAGVFDCKDVTEKTKATAPDKTGTLTTVEGKVFRLALWKVTSKDGSVQYLSGNIQVPEKQKESPAPRSSGATPLPQAGDDPF
jgi:hypothetical protein